MLNNVCSLLGQTLQSGCEHAFDNTYANVAAVIALGSLTVASTLFYAYKRKEEDFELEYIPRISDYLPKERVLPLQSLVKAYFAEGRDQALHKQYQMGIGKLRPSSPSDIPLTFEETVQVILEKLNLPLNGFYPPELRDTDKNAAQIVEWCLNRRSASNIVPKI